MKGKEWFKHHKKSKNKEDYGDKALKMAGGALVLGTGLAVATDILGDL